MLKITTKTGQVIETTESFETIQRAMVNKQLIEIAVKNRKVYIDPSSIESIEGEKEIASQHPYKVASNFPFKMTEEETLAMQMKMQPMKAMFDAKKEAMAEMKRKEDEAINNTFAHRYGGYMPKVQQEPLQERSSMPKAAIETPTAVEVPTEPLVAPTAPIVAPVPEVVAKKLGRPPKVK